MFVETSAGMTPIHLAIIVRKWRTKQTNEAMQRAEQNLGVFWQKFDDAMTARVAPVFAAVQAMVSNQRNLERTAD
jgi:hypothetical protein